MPWSARQLAGIRVEQRPNGRRLRCFAERPTDGLWAMLERSAGARPDGEALVLGAERVSYAELAARVERVAANLSVERGARVALLLGNSIEFAIAFFACQRLGAIAVPLNTRLRGPELESLLNQAGATVLISDSLYLDRLEGAQLPVLGHRFVIGSPPHGYRPWSELAEGDARPAPRVAVDEDDTACILYTSGTTGLPKGAMLTQFNLAHSLIHYERALALARTPPERSLLAVPMSHVTGLVAQLLPMVYLGGCTVIVPEFKADRFLDALAGERCTHTVVVPAIYVLCLMEPGLERLELPHWRVAGYGGAPMAQSTVAALAERFPRLRLHNVYGSTESCSPTTINPSERALSHADSVGLPLMCAELRVVDERGDDVPTGWPGELWIKGPMVVPGYWDNPRADRESFADGGYWRSGDVARLDEDGQVYILDRLKDMINRAGYKVYCAEVENVLYQHPDVLEAAVVGVPDPVLGERVKAALVPRAGHTLDAADVRAFCAARLADYKVPEQVEVRDALPRNAAGKAVKSLLKEPSSCARS